MGFSNSFPSFTVYGFSTFTPLVRQPGDRRRSAEEHMDHLLAQIEEAVGHDLYYPALFAALSIPDICGALAAEDGNSTGKRYRAWFDDNVASTYTQRVGPDLEAMAPFFPDLSARLPESVRQKSGKEYAFLTGDDCYHLRCSALHQARAGHPKGRYRRIMFVSPSAEGPKLGHCDKLNDTLLINAGAFCQVVVDAAQLWIAAQTGTEPFDSNLARTMQERLGTGMRGYPITSVVY